ncbi:YihY/virulence factor BrkB family protein [Agromyces mediolanus]|uniref:YihY/virulence factor BrkB family protein n=1 Tax=Agromyces mediolanus TaxID=41986 RepID=UPI001669036E|nr:YihY/virulence factor BrkB family protein [Agromyces mediolanus]MCD1573105.1 YihY/virulence factor BrkB family protein [Agromyces mediolanus]
MERPASPVQLSRAAWWVAARRTARTFFEGNGIDRAAALAFFSVLALFPAILVTASILALAGQEGRALGAAIDLAGDVLPRETVEFLRERLGEFAVSPAATLGVVTGAVVALWTASAYVTAFGRAMNDVYGVDEGRPVWKLRGIQLLVTAGFLALVSIIVLLLLLGGGIATAVAEQLGAGEAVQLTWAIARWPLMFAVLVCLIALLYRATPNVRQPRFRWLSVGAVLAIVVVAGASAAFAWYLTAFADYDRVYGSLAGAVVFLVWLWLVNGGLLIGAAFDAELERARELQAGAHAEDRILLEPRDTTRMARNAERIAAERERARRLRRDAGE